MQQFVIDVFTTYQQWLAYLAIASIIFLTISILFIPSIIARIPCDYFIKQSPKFNSHSFTPRVLLLLIVKNLIGFILIICGAIMLVLPGQGILTILVGILISDFPGKHRFERFLIKKPAALYTLNWIRRHRNVPDLRISPDSP